MKIPEFHFDSEVELHTQLSKIKLAFKVQHIHDLDEKLNVALQHLDGAIHKWGERWIAKTPRGDFNDFANALTQREDRNWDLPYDVLNSLISQKDLTIEGYSEKFQVLELRTCQNTKTNIA
jgi:hypothetical protein